MKLQLYSFICQFDEAAENVAIISTDDLKSFLSEHNLEMSDFKPDFINEKMDEFVFCIDNKEWKEFVSKFYYKCEVKIVLHTIQTPDDFDIYKYFSCNIYVIEYLINPEYRNKAFLMQNQQNIGSEYFINKMHGALLNPKTSKINSLYKLKMYWNELRFDGRLGSFQSHRHNILKQLSKIFPVTYCWVYDKFIFDSVRLSDKFKCDFFLSSEELLNRVNDCCDNIENEKYNTSELSETYPLPF